MGDTAPLHPDLSNYMADIVKARKMVAEIVDGLSDEHFRQRPALDEWSVAECIEHLNTTARATAPSFETAIEKGLAKNLLANSPLRYSRIDIWLVDNAVDYPPKRRFKAPKIFAPTADTHDRATILADFESAQKQMIGFLNRANGLNLRKVKVVSPVSKLLRLSLGQYFRLATGHQLRHLHQAADARRKVLSLTSLK